MPYWISYEYGLKAEFTQFKLGIIFSAVLPMRDPFLDTTKAVLIFLVVFGHFVERLIGWQLQPSSTVLSVIYLIHMPAFIFVSGMLFKDHNYLKNIAFFLSLYVPFQVIYFCTESMLSGQWNIAKFQFFQRPYWILWYLMGMMAWTLLSHFLIRSSYPLWIAIALCLGVGILPWNNYDYSVGRIFVFLPFFVAGVVYGPTVMERIKQQRYSGWIGAGLILLLTLGLIQLDLSQYWLYGSLSYAQLHIDPGLGIAMRVLCLCLACVGIWALLSLIKSFGTRWTDLGSSTLAVYLLHGLVVMLTVYVLQVSGVLDQFSQFGILLLALILSLLSCVILQQPLFDRTIRVLSLWLMKTYLKFSRKPD